VLVRVISWIVVFREEKAIHEITRTNTNKNLTPIRVDPVSAVGGIFKKPLDVNDLCHSNMWL